jgi:hypothetical protein
VLRSHVALGLARSGEASAVGLLANAYRFEVVVAVRRAIVRALGARTEPARHRTLELAAALDPDPETRRLARAGMAGRSRRPGTASGSRDLPARAEIPEALGTGWLRLPPPRPEDHDALLVVETSAGLALPLAPDPDGMVLVAGIAPGDAKARVVAATPGAPGSASPPPPRR